MGVNPTILPISTLEIGVFYSIALKTNPAFIFLISIG